MTIVTYSKFSKKEGQYVDYYRWQGWRGGKKVQTHCGRVGKEGSELKAVVLDIEYLTDLIENTKSELYLRKQRLELLHERAKFKKPISSDRKSIRNDRILAEKKREDHQDLSANFFIFHGGKNPGKDYKAPRLTPEMLSIEPDCPVAHKKQFYQALMNTKSPSKAIKSVYGVWNGQACCYTWYKNLITFGYINEITDDEEVKKYEDNLSKLR